MRQLLHHKIPQFLKACAEIHADSFRSVLVKAKHPPPQLMTAAPS